jgi:hypothetical protein
MYRPKLKGKVNMKAQSSSRRSLSYGVGALAVLVASIGVAAVVYALSLITFNAYQIPAWVLGPWGLYTIIYALVTSRDFTYYLAWGTIIFAVALGSALYTLINPFVIFGILLIVLVIIGLAAYWRGKR